MPFAVSVSGRVVNPELVTHGTKDMSSVSIIEDSGNHRVTVEACIALSPVLDVLDGIEDDAREDSSYCSLEVSASRSEMVVSDDAGEQSSDRY